MSRLSCFSEHDLNILRKVVKRIHNMYFKDLKMENQQADMMIESLMPETIDKYLAYGKHLHNKQFLSKAHKNPPPVFKESAKAVHAEISLSTNVEKAKDGV